MPGTRSTLVFFVMMQLFRASSAGASQSQSPLLSAFVAQHAVALAPAPARAGDLSLDATAGRPDESIPLSELGTKAEAQYHGDGLAVSVTEAGAQLRCVFQKLEGEVSPAGLWLVSTAEGGSNDRFQVIARTVGRAGAEGVASSSEPSLARTGAVELVGQRARFVRAGMVEEYSVSVDGVQQDFIISERPAGAGDLRLELALSGARSETAAQGARLTLEFSGRALAYTRLRAVDAKGRELAATLEVLSPERLAVCVADSSAAYPVRIDPTFSDADWVSLNPGLPGTNGPVFAAVVDGSGNLYIGGFFTFADTVLANHVAKWNGSAWSALGTGTDYVVYALAMSGTDLYAGGHFTTAGGVVANNIAKWDGSAWSALGTGVSGTVWALAVSGTDLYAGGDLTSAGGVAANDVAKWDGSAWSALGTGMDFTVYALAVGGTDLYAGGYFFTAGGVTVSNIAKWDGSAWSALGAGIDSDIDNAVVQALAVSGTDIYAGGYFTTAGGVAAINIAKWDGSAWSALGTGMNSPVSELAVSGTDLYVAADGVAKWNGSAWSSLGTGTGGVNALAVSGANLYAGGGFLTAGGVAASNIAKWDGSAWSALGTGMNTAVFASSVSALAVSGTDLYAGGRFRAGGVAIFNIAKWDGSAWSPLGTGVNSDVYALAVSGTDLYAGGLFTTAGGVTANFIAKWDGSAWSPLGTGMDGPVNALAVSGTDLYAGGDFSAAGGVTASIAKWDGSAWWALGTGTDGTVSALAVSGTDLYAGGYFSTVGGVTASIAKWDGIAWSALGSGTNGGVYALAVISTDLYVGGGFTTAGGVAANHVAKWDGSAWSALGMGTSNGVNALAVSGTDLYVGGRFTTAGGAPANRIAKWDGSTWSALGTGMDNSVLALASDAANHLFVGGDFYLAGTTVSPFIAQGNLSGGSTAVTLATMSADADAAHVRIRWRTYGDAIASTSLYRRTPDSDWTLVGHPPPDLNRDIVFEDTAVLPGIRYGYRLEVRDVLGQENSIETWVSVPQGQGVPAVLRLASAQPNPIGGHGQLNYGLPQTARVRLSVYDVQGRRVATLVDRVEEAGWRSATWDGRDSAGRLAASGTYFIRLEVAGTMRVQKVVVAR